MLYAYTHRYHFFSVSEIGHLPVLPDKLGKVLTHYFFAIVCQNPKSDMPAPCCTQTQDPNQPPAGRPIPASSESEMRTCIRLCFSDALRGVLRRKKSPLGYRSTPTGLKRKIRRHMIAMRNGSAPIWRSQIYTQARTHSERRIVRRFLLWWRWRESNPRPKVSYQGFLRVYPVFCHSRRTAPNGRLCTLVAFYAWQG